MRTSFLTALVAASAIGLAGCATNGPTRHYTEAAFNTNAGPADEYLPGWGELAPSEEDRADFSSRHHRGNNRHILGQHPQKHGAAIRHQKPGKKGSWLPAWKKAKEMFKCMLKCRQNK